MSQPPWWVGDLDVRPCGLCGCPIQRSRTGSLADGMRAHFDYVHPGRQVGVL